MLKSLGLDMPAAKAKDQNGQDAVGECQDENWNVWSQKVSNQEKFHLWFLIKIKPAGKSALQCCKTNYVNFTFAHTLGFNNSRKQHFGNLQGFRREHIYPLVWTSQNPKVMRDFFARCVLLRLWLWKRYEKDTGAYCLILLRSTICWFINSCRSLWWGPRGLLIINNFIIIIMIL